MQVKRIILSLLGLFIFFWVGAQKAYVSGTIIDATTEEVVDIVTVYVESLQKALESDENGAFRLEIPANEPITIQFKRLGYNDKTVNVAATPLGITRKIEVLLIPENYDLNIVVKDSRIRDLGMIREETNEIKLLPSVTGNLESALPSIALGVNAGSGGELTSQYSVRGGNYDENLIYVNDFEIFRPQLIRSGQQEGLTFPNIDLIQDISFSSGGFESKYGDKLSSVLDVRYKRPTISQSSISASFLGASLHTEGSKKIAGRNFTYLIGARYKTNQYLLNSLEIEGEYQPNHGDIQAYLTYDLSESWQVDFISNYNISQFNLTPESGRQAVGLINLAIQLTTAYDGSERDQFRNAMAGLAFNYLPERKKNPFYLKFLTSVYDSREIEGIDIVGRYRLSQIETSLGSENAGEEVALLGLGTQHLNARNILNGNIINYQHKGGYEIQLTENGSKSHFIQWGAKVQHEYFNDNLKEWERLDSAGFSLPFNEENVLVNTFLRTTNEIQSTRFNAHVQDSYTVQNDRTELRITGGLRAAYWTYNNEAYVTPRFQALYKPLKWEKDISFKFSSGLYYQPGFYRDFRRLDGTLNEDIRAQKSFHVVAGLTYDFLWKKVSDSPFKLISEFYYKRLWDAISYDIDNVRIRYSGENDSDGYVIGWDTRINGNFVPGTESWVNISILQARERIDGVEHRGFRGFEDVERTFVPRPTDQLVFANLFFQDYLPNNENFKAHFLLAFGSGIAYGIQGNNLIYRNTFRYPAYRRIDVGFSYQLWKRDWLGNKPNHPLRWSRNAWVSLEAFNLLGIENVASNTWIKSITNISYAIPDRLTGRRINLRFRVEI